MSDSTPKRTSIRRSAQIGGRVGEVRSRLFSVNLLDGELKQFRGVLENLEIASRCAGAAWIATGFHRGGRPSWSARPKPVMLGRTRRCRVRSCLPYQRAARFGRAAQSGLRRLCPKIFGLGVDVVDGDEYGPRSWAHVSNESLTSPAVTRSRTSSSALYGTLNRNTARRTPRSTSSSGPTAGMKTKLLGGDSMLGVDASAPVCPIRTEAVQRRVFQSRLGWDTSQHTGAKA